MLFLLQYPTILFYFNEVICASSNTPFRYKQIRIGALLQQEKNLLEYNYLVAALKTAKVDLDSMLNEYGYEISYTYKDSGCYGIKAAAGASDLIHGDMVHAIVGPSCTDGCLPVGSIAAGKNLPVISYSCPSARLSEKLEYPTLVRTKPFTTEAKNYFAKVILLMLQHFKWLKVGVVASYTDNWRDISTFVIERIRSLNDTDAEPIVMVDVAENKLEEMENLKRKSRIILFMCDSNVTTAMLTKAYTLNMYNGDYAFITIDYKREESFRNESWFITDKIYNGLLNINIRTLNNVNGIASYKQRINSQLIKYYGEQIQKFVFYDGAAYIYDAVKIYIKSMTSFFRDRYSTALENFLNETQINEFLALNNISLQEMEAIRNNLTADDTSIWKNHTWLWPKNWTLSNTSLPIIPYSKLKLDLSFEDIITNGTLIVSRILNSTCSNGTTGDVNIDTSGNRYPVLSVENFIDNGIFSRGTYSSFTQQFKPDGFSQIVWPGGKQSTPLSIPDCGFENENCKPEGKVSVSTVVLAIFGPIVGVAALFILHRIYKNNQYENDLLNETVLFKFHELEIPDLIAIEKEKIIEEKTTKRKNKKRLHADLDENNDNLELIPSTRREEGGSAKRTETLKFAKVPHRKSMDNVLAGIGELNKATGNRTFLGKINYDKVLVKKLPKSHVIITRDIRVEMKEMRDLQHINLNPYTKFCIGPPHVLLVSQVCLKGSLIDILKNEDIQLNWTIRIQFAIDIICGLQAIHDSTIKYHGRLTSNNVIIDSRWNCKICDYGMRNFKDMSKEKIPKTTDADIEDAKYFALLWTAPENINLPYPHMNTAGDIYSFGIILSELINRIPPYTTYTQYRPREYVRFVQKRCIPPFRPHVRLQAGLDGRILDLMRQCWDEFPENRPTIDSARETMKKIYKDKSDNTNLLDNMIEMMEKYAQGLEQRLKEVTIEKDQEREKFEKILFKALPPSIGEKMRNGVPVEPKLVEQASILLFEVDDFNSFIDSLTPSQCVDLVHDVHTVIDESMTPGMHKVKTYGDYHMICSGMPDRSKKHASNIARCALKIMGSLTKFRFRHIVDSLMRFRIVAHAGSFSTAVIGKTLPQYTVTGREVQYAEAVLRATPTLRILLTEPFKDLLPGTGYKYEDTGFIMIKGYGLISTSYLVGLAGLPVKLRSANLKEVKEVKENSVFKIAASLL